MTARISLELNDLVVQYNQITALNKANTVVSGNIIALIGHNGAGKSTLMKTILGLLPISSGKLIIKHSNNDEFSQIFPDEHMAFCPEEGAVFEDITVKEYLQLWARIKLNDNEFPNKHTQEVIDRLCLTPLLNRLGRELSKGQRRRVQTAASLMIEPRLCLLDEPFDGLDVLQTSELLNTFSTFKERMSFIISSHRMDVVERLADVIIVMSQGKVIASGSPKEIINNLTQGKSTSTTLLDVMSEYLSQGSAQSTVKLPLSA